MEAVVIALALCRVDALVCDKVTLVGEVSGCGVANVTDSVFRPAELAGAVAEDTALTTLLGELAAADEDGVLPLLQVRLYSGALLRSAPTMPKEGLGVVGAASCNVNHQVLILPRSVQATSCQ